MRPDRHSFVWLVPQWERHRVDNSVTTQDDHGVLANWAALSKPFVVASSRSDDAPETVRLGLAMPDKQRFGFAVHRQAIARCIAPPALRPAANVAPPSWMSTIERILTICDANGLRAAVYGSLAWTYLSGIDYLRPDSDVDLLLQMTQPELSRDAIAALCAITHGPRLDGELLLTSGNAVAIRELHRDPQAILVKGHGGARMVDLQSLAKQLARR